MTGLCTRSYPGEPGTMTSPARTPAAPRNQAASSSQRVAKTNRRSSPSVSTATAAQAGSAHRRSRRGQREIPCPGPGGSMGAANDRGEAVLRPPRVTSLSPRGEAVRAARAPRIQRLVGITNIRRVLLPGALHGQGSASRSEKYDSRDGNPDLHEPEPYREPHAGGFHCDLRHTMRLQPVGERRQPPHGGREPLHVLVATPGLPSHAHMRSRCPCGCPAPSDARRSSQ
jgi:hypothetical protein